MNADLPDGDAIPLSEVDDMLARRGRWAGVTVHLDEADRQLTIMALAHEAVRSPGMHDALRLIADTLGGSLMFDRCRGYDDGSEVALGALAARHDFGDGGEPR